MQDAFRQIQKEYELIKSELEYETSNAQRWQNTNFEISNIDKAKKQYENRVKECERLLSQIREENGNLKLTNQNLTHQLKNMTHDINAKEQQMEYEVEKLQRKLNLKELELRDTNEIFEKKLHNLKSQLENLNISEPIEQEQQIQVFKSNIDKHLQSYDSKDETEVKKLSFGEQIDIDLLREVKDNSEKLKLIKALAKVIKNGIFKSPISIDLEDVNLSGCWNILFPSIRKNKEIKELNLNNCNLSSAALGFIENIFENGCIIRSLKIANNRFQNIDIERFFNTLILQNSLIDTLDISGYEQKTKQTKLYSVTPII